MGTKCFSLAFHALSLSLLTRPSFLPSFRPFTLLRSDRHLYDRARHVCPASVPAKPLPHY